MAKPTINVCLIGQKFMGRTHSNAYLKVNKFFDLPVIPVMRTLAGRNGPELAEQRGRWPVQRRGKGSECRKFLFRPRGVDPIER